MVSVSDVLRRILNLFILNRYQLGTNDQSNRVIYDCILRYTVATLHLFSFQMLK